MNEETCAMFSGGKNSAAMVHRLIKTKKTPDIVVFCDGGLEFDETYQFIDYFEKKLGIEITREKENITFEDWFYKPYIRGAKEGQIHGFPMLHNRCYWQRESKGKIMERYNAQYHTVYVGFNSDETHRNLNRINHEYPLQVWGWDEKYCLNYCKKHDILNPLYDIYPRLGCWLCPYQSKKAMRSLYRHLMKTDPNKWEYLKKLEKDSPHGFKPDYDLLAFENEGLEDYI